MLGFVVRFFRSVQTPNMNIASMTVQYTLKNFTLSIFLQMGLQACFGSSQTFPVVRSPAVGRLPLGFPALLLHCG